jgi:hypothetical protein
MTNKANECYHGRVLGWLTKDRLIIGYCTDCSHEVEVRESGYANTGEKELGFPVYVSNDMRKIKPEGGMFPGKFRFA